MLYVIRYTTSREPGVTKTAVQMVTPDIGDMIELRQRAIGAFLDEWSVRQLPGVEVVEAYVCDPRRLRHGPIFID